MGNPTTIADRLGALLGRWGSGGDAPGVQELEEAYTEGCAVVLSMEADALRVKRRMRAAALDVGHDEAAERDLAALSAQWRQLQDEIEAVRQQVREVRSAFDSLRRGEAAPRKRFVRSPQPDA